MKISFRGWFVIVGGLAAVIVLLGTVKYPLFAQQEAPAVKGQLTEASLGNMLQAMGLRPKKTEKRYDFNFKATYGGEEWELTMSAVLSQNGKSIWIMAWLDELPRSAADVPRTALLRLLANNDRLGKGKFFAYIATNRRFVLQRIIDNRELSTRSVREALHDLGSSVVETFPHWSVANWKAKSSTSAGSSAKAVPSSGRSAPAQPVSPGRTGPARSAQNNSKFRQPIRK